MLCCCVANAMQFLIFENPRISRFLIFETIGQKRHQKNSGVVGLCCERKREELVIHCSHGGMLLPVLSRLLLILFLL